MSPTAAVSVIALVVAVVALLAMVGLQRELNGLEAYVKAGIGSTAADVVGRTGDGALNSKVVLKFDPYCASCRPLFDYFVSCPTVSAVEGRVVLTTGQFPTSFTRQSREVQLIENPTLFNSLRTPWVPAMIHVDSTGTVVDAAACVSEKSIDEFLAAAAARAGMAVQESL